MEIGEPKDGEIRVKIKAIGLNFIDVYFRKGVYKVSAVPYTPGLMLSCLLSFLLAQHNVNLCYWNSFYNFGRLFRINPSDDYHEN